MTTCNLPQLVTSDCGDALVSLSDASILLNAIVGTPNPRTMCVHGFTNRKQVVILIDTDSTHNFLDLALVQKH